MRNQVRQPSPFMEQQIDAVIGDGVNDSDDDKPVEFRIQAFKEHRIHPRC